MRFSLVLVILLSLCAPAAMAQNRAALEADFHKWLEQEIWPRAKQNSVSRGVFDAAFQTVTLDLDLPDLVLPGHKKPKPQINRQSEFGVPAKYFRDGVIAPAVGTGQNMAKLFKTTLKTIEARSGVPAPIILAIWGRESAYGQAKIPHDAFRVLGTKAFLSTRAAYFEDELVAALVIAQQGHVAPRNLKSSWAGALGQPQFMPSSFLKYAADGNGDGRFDIWASPEDTIASIAHYLTKHGWDKRRDWGFEVTLPPGLSCALEGPDQGKPIKDWVDLGVKRVSGKPFPASEQGGMGFLMMPAGTLGPAFIVTPNFYVLKDYNESDLYALFVGHVADRIAYGGGDFRAPWAAQDKLLRGDVADMQKALIARGHDVGGADGLVGNKTRRSIGKWQQSVNAPQTCFPDKSVIRAITKGR